MSEKKYLPVSAAAKEVGEIASNVRSWATAGDVRTRRGKGIRSDDVLTVNMDDVRARARQKTNGAQPSTAPEHRAQKKETSDFQEHVEALQAELERLGADTLTITQDGIDIEF